MRIFTGTHAPLLKKLATYTLPCLLSLGLSAQAAVTVDRSVFITDKVILNQITLQDVVNKLIADTGDSRTATQVLSSAPLSISDSGVQGSMLSAMLPLAISNRFDLAPANGANCGEYRIAFGGNHPFGNGFATFLIFEAKYPNPNPAQGLNGCRPVADFWANLSTINDPVLRGAQLRQFYLSGINGLPAVVDVNNYRGQENPSGASGQIRRNVRASRATSWTFNEFRTVVDGSRNLNIITSTVKDVPDAQFAQDSQTPNALAFQQAVIAGLNTPNANLLATNMSSLGYSLPFSLDKESDNIPSIAFTDNSRLFAPNNFNTTGQFAQSLQTKLNQVGSPLTPIQVINRVNALTCGGCHGQGQDLGNGLVFDTAAQNREFLNPFAINAVMGQTQHIEAETWSQMSGVQTESTSDTGGGLNVGWIDPNDWIVYSNVNINAPTREYNIQLRLANGINTPARLRLEQPGGGAVYAEFELQPTFGWQNWQTQTARVIIPGGINGLAIKALSGNFNINWIEITPVMSGSFDVKPSLTNTFLPERKAIFEQFLANSSCTTCNTGPNMLSNGDFTSSANWQTYIDGQANASIVVGGASQQATVNITNGGSQTWMVQMTYPNLNIVNGKTYELKFTAKSLNGQNTSFEAMLERNGGDWAKYLVPQIVNVSATQNTFTYTFTMNQATDSAARITFNMGTHTGSLAIDNVSLRQIGQ